MTSQSVEDPDDDTAAYNSAGYWHSNLYGFGVIDASFAVDAALAWENLPAEQSVRVDRDHMLL